MYPGNHTYYKYRLLNQYKLQVNNYNIPFKNVNKYLPTLYFLKFIIKCLLIKPLQVYAKQFQQKHKKSAHRYEQHF